MKPWDRPLAASHEAPVLLSKHADQLDAEAEAAAKQADAESAKKGDAHVRVRIQDH